METRIQRRKEGPSFNPSNPFNPGSDSPSRENGEVGDNGGMPEAPDLYVLREYLAPRIEGEVVDVASELRPLVVRNMAGVPLAEDISGRTIERLDRKGKLLMMSLSGGVSMVVSPMLTGELSLSDPGKRVLKSTILTVNLGVGKQLRYLDSKRMGQIYYLETGKVDEITRVADQGPDVLDAPLSLADFRAALRPFRGEVKGVLTRGQLVAGIGNAYADEVLWSARIYPFRKVTKLSADDVAQLREAVYEVPRDAVNTLREIFGDRHPRKDRKFLSVHGKPGKPCPRCGSKISSVKSRQRDTNFCRRCQPGSMFE